jgi:hypothetical protein
MAGEALFLGWGPVVRGREQKAVQVFQETIEYYGRLQQEGKIDSFEPVLIAPHGGDLGGFVLLRGERAKLDEIRTSDEFERAVVRAATVVDRGPASSASCVAGPACGDPRASMGAGPWQMRDPRERSVGGCSITSGGDD